MRDLMFLVVQRSTSVKYEQLHGVRLNTTSLNVPLTAPKKPSTTAVTNPKAKVRAAFSESQMNALVQRFSVQRYLTPAEMKNLAELTGMTYKQVRNL